MTVHLSWAFRTTRIRSLVIVERSPKFFKTTLAEPQRTEIPVRGLRDTDVADVASRDKEASLGG